MTGTGLALKELPGLTQTEAERRVVLKAEYKVEPTGELRAVPADRGRV